MHPWRGEAACRLDGLVRTEIVTAPPHTAMLYARAVAGSVLPGVLWGGGDRIPSHSLTRPAVRFSTDEVHSYREVCGGSGPDLPPAMLHLAGFPLAMQLMTARDFPLGALGMVHIANHIDVRAPLPALATYTVTAHIEQVRAHRKGTQFDVVTAATLDGEEVWRESSTYLSRGRQLPAVGEVGPPPQWPSLPSDAEVENLEVASDVGRRYGSVSGDRNPIHMHPMAARVFGFPTAIAHGMWTLARCLAQVEEQLPVQYVVDAGFFKPVLLPADCSLAVARTADGRAVWLSSRDELNAVVVVADGA
jgi:acyl dehydratase